MTSNIASLANHSQNCTKDQDVLIVMVPFPAQGHLNQLPHLSRLVSSYHLPICYISFSISIQQAKHRVHGWGPVSDTTPSNIHFKKFPLPSTHVQSPNCSNMSKFIASTLDLSLTLREPINAYLNGLSSTTRRLVIIYDSLMACVVQDIVSIPNAEAYCFRVVSAFTTCSILWEGIEKFFHLPKFLGKFIATKLLKIPQQLPSLESSFTQELLDFIFMQDRHNNICSGNIFDTCKVIEGPFLESLEKLHRLLRRGNQWAIGPFNPIKIQKDSKDCHKCLKWLDKQEPKSVILVSFGTTSSLSSEQIKELAIGLEKSSQKFIWVVRDVLLGEDEEVNIPNGYEERIEGRGIVVKDWAPQFEILAHSSTCGFLSHCGWNSCMESITMGVPIATWPMSFDQPRNAVLVTNVLKIGIVVKDWEHCEDLVTSITIQNAVRKLMVSSEGNEMRKRAMEIGKRVRESMMDGGVSRREMDSFISHVTRY